MATGLLAPAPAYDTVNDSHRLTKELAALVPNRGPRGTLAQINSVIRGAICQVRELLSNCTATADSRDKEESAMERGVVHGLIWGHIGDLIVSADQRVSLVESPPSAVVRNATAVYELVNRRLHEGSPFRDARGNPQTISPPIDGPKLDIVRRSFEEQAAGELRMTLLSAELVELFRAQAHES